MTDHRRHKIVGSEAHEPRPMAYMRSGRRNHTLSARGVVFLFVLGLAGFLVLAAAMLPR